VCSSDLLDFVGIESLSRMVGSLTAPDHLSDTKDTDNGNPAIKANNAY